MNNTALYVFRFCAIATAYWASSWLGKHVAIPFGQATDIWLAAGVALACCVLYGNKYWPAIAVGSLLTHYQIYSTIHMTGITIGLGGGLQAAFGAWAFKKSVSKNSSDKEDIYTLERATDIVKLIFWGGIIACMINATIGTISLSRTGWTQLGIELAHWYVWWIGDVLGVILFAPALILILSDIKNAKKKISWRRKLSIASAGLVLFLAVTIIFAVIKREYYNQSNQLFRDNTQNIAGRLEKNFELYLNTISAIGNFVNASENVSFDGFRIFTKTFLERYPSIAGLVWVPKITNAGRPAFEQYVQDQGLADFEIKQYVEADTFKTSEEKPLYFPITYIQPYNLTFIVAGLDIYTDPLFKELLDTSAAAGMPKSSVLISKTRLETLYDIIIFNPVYSHSLTDYSVEERKLNLKGYAIGVFLLSDLFQEAYETAKKNGQDFIIKDMSLQNGGVTFYDTRTKDRKPDSALSYDFELRTHAIKRFNVADRMWEITFIQAGKATQFTHYSWGLWFTITLGTLFAIMITVSLLVITARTDIVERLVEQKTSALKSAEKFQKLITDTIPDLLYVKDKNLQFVMTNPVAEQLISQNMNTPLIGHTVSEFLPKEESKIIEEQDIEAFEKGYVEGEQKLTTPSGKKIFVSVKEAAFQDSEGNSYILGLARDITERKETEIELRNLNTELEEFSYRTSHDLRAPVVSALGLLDLVRNSLDRGNTDEVYRGIEHIYGSLQKVDVLVESILDITAIKRKEEEKKEVNVKRLLEETIEKFRYMDNFENIEIQQDFRFKGKLINQESRIRVVLENLTSNAIKYYDPEKENPFIKISTFKDGHDFVLRIEDNGLGIPKEYRGKLFQMFKRFHPKISFGSGLGLYLVQKSAEVLKGEISYENTGNGSAFTFRLPL